jgi:hypothetical protein
MQRTEYPNARAFVSPPHAALEEKRREDEAIEAAIELLQ